MIRKKPALGLDPRVATGFPKRSCAAKILEAGFLGRPRCCRVVLLLFGAEPLCGLSPTCGRDGGLAAGHPQAGAYDLGLGSHRWVLFQIAGNLAVFKHPFKSWALNAT